MVRNTQDAEDLAQQAFIQVMRKIHTFRGEAALSTWLYRVVMTTVLMQLRKKRLPLAPLDEILDVGGQSIWQDAAMQVVGDTLRNSNTRIDVARALSRLAIGFKRVFLLHDVEGYHHNEIARIMGCSVGTSKSQLYKARRRLRQLLRDEQPRLAQRLCGGCGEKSQSISSIRGNPQGKM